ncbi:uncharacterized protein BDR25DRAFT_360681 [Lindgomyces ingoldianus]|uniref:Uncharacterized protein n=1 Tax=Lindgomyces ingoldianus TaxID=673940 RepID=A0ACB6QGQ0_9PLEO|nr:uncharacterized protein BDR25DRAFT_360681 [Lindgomyces ingoldianus]KAF2465321.1 hypothetical protein BDR25DRAFT_360681 [Lindgomyces ingoldianus]
MTQSKSSGVSNVLNRNPAGLVKANLKECAGVPSTLWNSQGSKEMQPVARPGDLFEKKDQVELENNKDHIHRTSVTQDIRRNNIERALDRFLIGLIQGKPKHAEGEDDASQRLQDSSEPHYSLIISRRCVAVSCIKGIYGYEMSGFPPRFRSTIGDVANFNDALLHQRVLFQCFLRLAESRGCGKYLGEAQQQSRRFIECHLRNVARLSSKTWRAWRIFVNVDVCGMAALEFRLHHSSLLFWSAVMENWAGGRRSHGPTPLGRPVSGEFSFLLSHPRSKPLDHARNFGSKQGNSYTSYKSSGILMVEIPVVETSSVITIELIHPKIICTPWQSRINDSSEGTTAFRRYVYGASSESSLRPEIAGTANELREIWNLRKTNDKEAIEHSAHFSNYTRFSSVLAQTCRTNPNHDSCLSEEILNVGMIHLPFKSTYPQFICPAPCPPSEQLHAFFLCTEGLHDSGNNSRFIKFYPNLCECSVPGTTTLISAQQKRMLVSRFVTLSTIIVNSGKTTSLETHFMNTRVNFPFLANLILPLHSFHDPVYFQYTRAKHTSYQCASNHILNASFNYLTQQVTSFYLAETPPAQFALRKESCIDIDSETSRPLVHNDSVIQLTQSDARNSRSTHGRERLRVIATAWSFPYVSRPNRESYHWLEVLSDDACNFLPFVEGLSSSKCWGLRPEPEGTDESKHWFHTESHLTFFINCSLFIPFMMLYHSCIWIL